MSSGSTSRKPKCATLPPETCRGGVLGEGEDVVPTRRLSVDEPISAPELTQTEDLIKAETNPGSETCGEGLVRVFA